VPPADPDFDGLFKDANGNRRPDFADVVLSFNQMARIEENGPTALFSYNGNGRIDFADVTWLATTSEPSPPTFSCRRWLAPSPPFRDAHRRGSLLSRPRVELILTLSAIPGSARAAGGRDNHGPIGRDRFHAGE